MEFAAFICILLLDRTNTFQFFKCSLFKTFCVFKWIYYNSWQISSPLDFELMPYKYLGFQSPLLLRTHKTDILFQYVFFQVSGMIWSKIWFIVYIFYFHYHLIFVTYPTINFSTIQIENKKTHVKRMLNDRKSS